VAASSASVQRLGPGHRGLELRLLLQDALGLGVVVPEVRMGGVALDLRDARAFPLDVKDSP